MDVTDYSYGIVDICVQNNSHFCPDQLLPVDESPFDFRTPQRVDYRIDTPNEHLRIMKGMSACWVLRGWDGTLKRAADLYDPQNPPFLLILEEVLMWINTLMVSMDR